MDFVALAGRSVAASVSGRQVAILALNGAQWWYLA